MNIAIIGLGLIGGSLARAAKTRTCHTVFGHDADSEVMTLARMCGAIDHPLTDEALESCGLVLIALRPGAAVNWLEANAKSISHEATVVDMCGVKRAVCAPMAELAASFGFSYIGGHPMAGKERGGFVNSTESLFDGASMILTPDKSTSMPMLETLKNFFTDLGFASLTFTTPQEHDEIIAYTSQLAHITSSAYVRSPDAQKRRGFSAGSFKDMTRVALLDEDMWTELMMDNRDNLADQLDILIGHLQEYQQALHQGDAAALKSLLRDGREKKATAGGA